MTSRNQIEAFLKELKSKVEIFGLIYHDNRGKNAQAILDLNITPVKRTEIIKKLEPEDFSEGPINEVMMGLLPMWIFGKMVNTSEVYIKISLGNINSQAVCISFHLAEHPLNYPFKH